MRHPINGTLHTVAIRGSDEVQFQMKDDPKKSLTVIACCSRDGERLPLWVIAKGKTQICERKYRDDTRLRHFIQHKEVYTDHSESGWSDQNLMIRYLQFLKDFKKGIY